VVTLPVVRLPEAVSLMSPTSVLVSVPVRSKSPPFALSVCGTMPVDEAPVRVVLPFSIM